MAADLQSCPECNFANRKAASACARCGRALQRVVAQGGRFTPYNERYGARIMTRDEITIRIALNRGHASAKIWTTDLSYEYVRINAAYRT